MKKFIIGVFLLTSVTFSQSVPYQPDSLTLEKLAEKFANEHTAEVAHCFILKVTNDQLIDMNTKLIGQINDLQKQLDALKNQNKENKEDKKEVKP